MWKLLACVGFLSGAVFGAKKEFPTLDSSGSVNDIEVAIESSVERKKEIPKEFADTIEKGTPTDGYFLYRYVLMNKSSEKMQLHLGSWEFIHTPFTSVLQSFQAEVAKKSKQVVAFLTLWKPKEHLTTINIGIYDPKTKLYSYGGLGRANVYLPVRPKFQKWLFWKVE